MEDKNEKRATELINELVQIVMSKQANEMNGLFIDKPSKTVWEITFKEVVNFSKQEANKPVDSKEKTRNELVNELAKMFNS